MEKSLWDKGLLGGNRGYIFLVSLGFAILLGMGGLLAVSRTLEEVQSAGQQLRDMQTFFRADGGAALCLRELRNRVQRDLAAELRTLTDIIAVGSYLNDPAGFLATYAYQGGSSFGGAWQRISASEAHLTPSYTSAGAAGSYSCTLSAISRGAPVNQGTPMSPVYLFRYRYVIDSSATDGGITRQVNLQGIFSVQVQLDNFARYALFTNRQRNAGGSQVWFTNRTNFSGPVHTNGEFNFAMNPGAAFTGAVTSVSTTADYYNGGSPVHINGSRNGTLDVPTFGEGFERGVPSIPMPSTTTADRQREAALGLPAGASTAGYGPGVHLGTASGAMTGGIYIKGNASMTMTAGTNTATYSITHGSTVTTVTATHSSNQTTIRIGSGSPTTYSGLPNGMVFTDGSLTGLSGTVQKDSQVTVAAAGDVQITDNITYQDYTPGASPSAEGTTNVLGIISWTSDVHIGTTAPSDINIHATIMTPIGEFRVDGYDTGSFRGTATILGGGDREHLRCLRNLLAEGAGHRVRAQLRLRHPDGEGNGPPLLPHDRQRHQRFVRRQRSSQLAADELSGPRAGSLVALDLAGRAGQSPPAGRWSSGSPRHAGNGPASSHLPRGQKGELAGPVPGPLQSSDSGAVVAPTPSPEPSWSDAERLVARRLSDEELRRHLPVGAAIAG